MTVRATQPISSAFGSYMPGDPIDEAAAPVIEAWLAAGIIVDEPEEEPMAETTKPPAPKRVEKATAPKPERAVSRRMQTEPTPHRRFRRETDAAPQRRFVQDAGQLTNSQEQP